MESVKEALFLYFLYGLSPLSHTYLCHCAIFLLGLSKIQMFPSWKTYKTAPSKPVKYVNEDGFTAKC